MKKVVIYERGFIHDKIPINLFNNLMDSLKLEDIDSKPDFSHNLAGNIEIEKNVSELVPPNFYLYLISVANEYCKQFIVDRFAPFESVNIEKQFNFSNLWLNYQKKYEFNPSHNHGGTLSFVIWCRIPYDLKEELALPNAVKSNHKCNSMFDFTGDDYDFLIPVDKGMEGDIIMFDSKQRHQVYPFYTSDDYRISMSGNISVQMLKNID